MKSEGIAHVKYMVILGVTISHDLVVSHVEGIIASCSRSLYTLRVLSANDLPGKALHLVTKAITKLRLLYASPVWGITTERKRQT